MFLPNGLRNNLILMAVLMVCVPTLAIGYFVEVEGREALLLEKEKKLFGVTRLLDDALGNDFSLYAHLPRDERIQALNAHLSSKTEHIARAFSGIGAGYYHRELDAIITYAPDQQYREKVGITIDEEHQGRAVMRDKQPVLASGKQVRGHILNAMIPIEREGKTIGYIWANELSEDISQQAQAMDMKIMTVLIIGLLISLVLIIQFSHRFSAGIEMITRKLAYLPRDLNTRLPAMWGELGEIAHSVNRLAQALGESKTLNELIIENAADGVIAVDKNGCVTMMNPVAEEITGYQQHELLGQPYYARIFAETGYLSPVLDTLEKGTQHVALEVSFPSRHRTIELSVTSSQIYNASNELVGALVIFSDLTARKEVQRRMAQAERLATLGELMAGVAHEVRNPLTAIKGYAQILQERETQPEQLEYIQIILKEIQSINRVIQQLLDFARPQTNRWQKASLNRLIQECLILIKTKGVEARIAINSELDNSLEEIEVDGELLKQVILNILINAVQSISARGEITITTRRQGEAHQAVTVKDSGCGISAQSKDKIFDPFYTTKPAGTGLGLAISHRIINAHHGDIIIESELNQGTAFTLVLPVRQNREPSA